MGRSACFRFKGDNGWSIEVNDWMFGSLAGKDWFKDRLLTLDSHF